MEPLCELDQLYQSQLTILSETKRMYKYLVNNNILDRESYRLFRELIRKGKKELWKSYLCIKKSYKQEEKNRLNRRRIIFRNKLEQ